MHGQEVKGFEDPSGYVSRGVFRLPHTAERLKMPAGFEPFIVSGNAGEVV